MRFRDVSALAAVATLGAVAVLTGGCSLIDAAGDEVASSGSGYKRSNIPNTSAMPRAVAVGALNGSLSRDVVVLDENGDVMTCVNMGDQTVFNCMRHPEATGYELVALAHLDSGPTDIIIVAALGRVDTYSFMGGPLVKRSLAVPATFRPKKLMVGTFAVHPKQAIVVTSADTPEIRIYLDPIGNPTVMTMTTMNGNPVDAVVANVNSGADATGDELIVSEGGDIVTYAGSAFTRTAQSLSGGSANALAAGAFGSGGDADIVWSHLRAEPGELGIFHGSPTGLFDMGTRFAPGFATNNVHVVDLDGDGLDDVAALYTELAGKQQLKRFLARPTGGFTGGFTEDDDLVLEGPARQVVFGDLDTDGVDDILIVPGAGGGVDLLLTK